MGTDIALFTLFWGGWDSQYTSFYPMPIHNSVSDQLLRESGALRRAFGLVLRFQVGVYLELVYLVTALVPSDTACLASSPGRSRRTAVWISREVMVERRL